MFFLYFPPGREPWLTPGMGRRDIIKKKNNFRQYMFRVILYYIINFVYFCIFCIVYILYNLYIYILCIFCIFPLGWLGRGAADRGRDAAAATAAAAAVCVLWLYIYTIYIYIYISSSTLSTLSTLSTFYRDLGNGSLGSFLMGKTIFLQA